MKRKEADFFCFGTNDLTQMTFGFSRDDAKKSFVDDETKAKLEEAAKKAEEIAKELAEQSADVAKASLEGLKAGVDAAIKAYKENRNK